VEGSGDEASASRREETSTARPVVFADAISRCSGLAGGRETTGAGWASAAPFASVLDLEGQICS
jgi:hypothetical protein